MLRYMYFWRNIQHHFDAVMTSPLNGSYVSGPDSNLENLTPSHPTSSSALISPQRFPSRNSQTIRMLSTRILARVAARSAARPQQSRLALQSRRFASESSKATESTFIKEREAVKQHAAESSGPSHPTDSDHWIFC